MPEVDLWSSYSQAHIHTLLTPKLLEKGSKIQKSRSGLEVFLGFEAGRSTLSVNSDENNF